MYLGEPEFLPSSGVEGVDKGGREDSEKRQDSRGEEHCRSRIRQ